MALTKYTCGCGASTTSSSGSCSSCCSSNVQTAPAPCCESHDIVYKTGVCFRVTCSVAARADTFYLTFANADCQDVPINANEVFFYHKAAGLMQIVSYDGVAYGVRLVDASKVGVSIDPTDCVLLTVQSETSTATLNTRCLSGNFTAPGVNADANIYILNGTGIPIGATITFTYQGETGSYSVKSYVGVANNIYEYVITNTGSGHTPGTTIIGDCDGACTVPIEVISDVDVCNLAATENVDNLTGCLNGSPRAVESSGEGFTLVGDGSGGWEQQKMIESDCCIVLDGCLKFLGNVCPDGTDTVLIKDVNLTCFEDAYNEAVAAGQNLPVVIDGYRAVITDYDSGTKLITVQLTDTTPVETLLEFPAGTQVCLGACCDSCVGGTQYIYTPAAGIYGWASEAPPVGSPTPISAPSGLSYWLIGYQAGVDPATPQVIEVDAAYIATLATNTICGLPSMATDPYLLRQKICNSSANGCNQVVDLQFNYELAFKGLAAGDSVYYEFHHYAAASEFLEDGVTPNTLGDVATQTRESGVMHGPTDIDSLIAGSEFGLTGGCIGVTKYMPVMSGHFHDQFNLIKCNCAMSTVHFFIRLNMTAPATVDFQFAFRRLMFKEDGVIITTPANDPSSDDYA